MVLNDCDRTDYNHCALRACYHADRVFAVSALLGKKENTGIYNLSRQGAACGDFRYAGGLLLQEYFPAAGTVRTARADRRHCHRSGTLLEEKHASLRWRRDTVLHVSCSDNF